MDCVSPVVMFCKVLGIAEPSAPESHGFQGVSGDDSVLVTLLPDKGKAQLVAFFDDSPKGTVEVWLEDIKTDTGSQKVLQASCEGCMNLKMGYAVELGNLIGRMRTMGYPMAAVGLLEQLDGGHAAFRYEGMLTKA